MITDMRNILRNTLLIVCAVIAGACDRQPEVKPQAPHWTPVVPKIVTPPNWTVSSEAVDMTSRTFCTIALSEDVSAEDKMAAFCMGTCVGTAQLQQTPMGWRFYLVIHRPNGSNPGLITLAYYSRATATIRYWPRVLAYEHDAIIGSTDQPYSPETQPCTDHLLSVDCYASLPAKIQPAKSDELAFFAGDQCLAAIDPMLQTGQDEEYCFILPLLQESQTIEARYYVAATGQTYTSRPIEVSIRNSMLKLMPIPF